MAKSRILRRRSEPTPPEPTTEQRVKTALAICSTFWGSNGSPGAHESLRSQLRVMKLSSAEIHELRDDLPVGATGLVGAKVTRVNRFLKRLIHETA